MESNLRTIIRKNKQINLQIAIIVMAVLTTLKNLTLKAIRKVNLIVAGVVKASLIIDGTKLPITVDQLVVPIAPNLSTSLTTARINASCVAK